MIFLRRNTMTGEELAIESRRMQQLWWVKDQGSAKKAEKDILVEVNGGEGFKKLAVNRLSVTENSSKILLHLAIRMLYVVLVREVSAKC